MAVFRNNIMVLELCMKDKYNAVFKRGDMYIYAYGVKFGENNTVEWQHGTYNLTWEQANRMFRGELTNLWW